MDLIGKIKSWPPEFWIVLLQGGELITSQNNVHLIELIDVHRPELHPQSPDRGKKPIPCD